MNRKKLLALTVLAALGAMAAFAIERANKFDSRRAHIGHEMPDFELGTLSGNTLSSRDLNGNPYALLFFREGCSFCREEMTELKTLIDIPRLLPVSLSSVEETLKTKEEWGITVDLYHGGQQLANHLGIVSVPSLILVDSKGRVQYKQTGLRNRAFHLLVFQRFSAGESLSDEDLRAAYSMLQR